MPEMTFTLSTVPLSVTVASRMTTPSTRARLASAGYFGCSMWTTFGCLTLPPTRTGAGGGGGGGTLPVPPSTPPSKPPGKPVVAPPITPLRAPEAPLGGAVSTILAISFGTLTGAVNSGFSTGTGSDSTTAGVSVGDVFSTAAWRRGSGALLTDNGGGGGAMSKLEKSFAWIRFIPVRPRPLSFHKPDPQIPFN